MKNLHRWILVKVNTSGSYIIESYKTRDEQRNQLRIFNHSHRNGDWVASAYNANKENFSYLGTILNKAKTSLTKRINLQNKNTCTADSTKTRPKKLPTTLQQIFNIVWERAKDTRVAEEEDSCLYRTKSGLACFIGQCIPDKLYTPEMEGYLSHIGIELPLDKRYTWDRFIVELRELQDIHDSKDPSLWNKYLINFAKKHNLKVPK